MKIQIQFGVVIIGHQFTLSTVSSPFPSSFLRCPRVHMHYKFIDDITISAYKIGGISSFGRRKYLLDICLQDRRNFLFW